MTDAVALLALSQLVCLGGLGYLYLRVQELKSAVANTNRASRRAAVGAVAARAAERAYRGPNAAPASVPGPQRNATVPLAQPGRVDVAALARQLHRSEEEVRLLLRHRGVLP